MQPALRTKPALNQKETQSLTARFGDKLPIYYQCECGKSYTDFPALYLHFQRKHNIRISKDLENQNCCIDQKPGHRVIKYFYTQNHSNSINAHPIKEHWEQLIDDYTNKEISDSPKGSSDKQCLRVLRNYVRKIHLDLENMQNEQRMGYQLGFYLNQFMLKHVDSLSIRVFWEWSRALTKFIEWQNKKGYSTITIECNTLFRPE